MSRAKARVGRPRKEIDLTSPRKCIKCHTVKPAGQFNPQVRKWTKKDGSITKRIYLSPYCKACSSKRLSEWYKTPPGRKAKQRYNDTRYERIKSDPKQLAKHKKKSRLWQREHGAEYQMYVRYLRPLMK